MIPSAEFEKTANCCKTANLKTVHSHHSGKRKSKCKLQIAAKQNKKCLLVTIWRKKQITNCSKKITYTIQGKEKAKFKLQRNKTKNVSCHHLGKEKVNYKLQQKKMTILQNVSAFHTFQHMPMLSRTCQWEKERMSSPQCIFHRFSYLLFQLQRKYLNFRQNYSSHFHFFPFHKKKLFT